MFYLLALTHPLPPLEKGGRYNLSLLTSYAVISINPLIRTYSMLPAETFPDGI